MGGFCLVGRGKIGMMEKMIGRGGMRMGGMRGLKWMGVCGVGR